MGITLSGQLGVFLLSGVCGAILGAFYDFLRLFRLIVYSGRRQLFFQDIFYFFICGIVTFLFALAVNFGEVRFFLLAGEGIGWLVYHLTLGALVYRFSSLLVVFLKRIFSALNRLFLAPVKRAFKRLFSFWQNQFKKVTEKIKKKLCKSKRDLKQQENLLYNANKPNSKMKKRRKFQRKSRERNEDRQKK